MSLSGKRQAVGKIGLSFFRVRQSTARSHQNLRRRIMKRSVALALPIFLGLGLLSTSLSVARDAIGGLTSWSGSYITK